jgi:hypothetical protein
MLHALRELVAEPAAPRTMDELWRRYVEHVATAVTITKEGFDWHMRHQADNFPELVLNLFCHGPIERGLDVSAGGVDIYNLTMDGVGLATVADSFAAIVTSRPAGVRVLEVQQSVEPGDVRKRKRHVRVPRADHPVLGVLLLRAPAHQLQPPHVTPRRSRESVLRGALLDSRKRDRHLHHPAVGPELAGRLPLRNVIPLFERYARQAPSR